MSAQREHVTSMRPCLAAGVAALRTDEIHVCLCFNVLTSFQMSARANPTSLYDRAQRAAEQIRARTKTTPTIAVVLGSGLGGFADELNDATALAYNEIHGFAHATVEGHAGRLVIGQAGDV